MIMRFRDEDDEREVLGFKQKFLSDCLPGALRTRAMFEEAKGTRRFSLRRLVAIQEETLGEFALLLAALPPREAEKFFEKLAALLGPQWRAARARTKAMAEQALAIHAGGG